MGSTAKQHWTSMFKAKHTCNQYCQNDVAASNMSSAPPCPHRSPSTSASKERTREPKPRWNPKPEQIRILQNIFDSGMINPPREDIQKIRAQLQVYGEVGEANVYYWFQNRKSRIKYKKRLEEASTPAETFLSPTVPVPAAVDFNNHLRPDLFLPTGNLDELFLSDLTPWTNVNHHQTMAGDNYRLYEDEIMMHMMMCQKDVPSADNALNVGQLYNYPALFSAANGLGDELFDNPIAMPSANNFINITPKDVTTPSNSTSSSTTQTQQDAVHGFELGDIFSDSAPTTMARCTVFINGVAFDTGFGPVNIRETFGGDVVLVDSSGNLVVTDDMGFILQPLQDGAFYYLVQLSALLS